MSIRTAARARAIDGLLRYAPAASRLKARALRARALEFFFDPLSVHAWLLGAELHRQRSGSLHTAELKLWFVPEKNAAYDPEPELGRRYALQDVVALCKVYDFACENESFAERAMRPSSPPSPALLQRAARVVAAASNPEQQLELIAELFAPLWLGPGADLGARPELSPEQLERAERVGAAQLSRRGHYQGGTLWYGGEWFAGVDRLPHLISRLTRLPYAAARQMVFRAREARPNEARTWEARPNEARAGEALTEPSLAARSALPPLIADSADALELECYFSFRSPYSYLALPRVVSLARRNGLALSLRPVLPMVMRGLAVPRAKQLHLVFDAAREARALGLPFGKICDPVGLGAERCLAAWVAARAAAREVEFSLAATTAIWSAGVDMSRGPGLRRVCEQSGVDWTRVQAQLASGGWGEVAAQHRASLSALGLWGVPSFRVGSFACWGQDRLELLEAHVSELIGAR